MKKITTGLAVLSFMYAAAVYADGPSGVGEVKIGLTKGQLHELSENSNVRLIYPLSAYVYKSQYDKRIEGIDKFNGKIATPYSSTPLDVVVSFQGDNLVGISVELGSADVYHQIQRQISEKYPDFEVYDGMREQDCIYRNGNSFKIKTGVVSSIWNQGNQDGRITTTLAHGDIRFCPSNLARDGIGGSNYYNLNIYVPMQEKKKEPEIKNQF